MRNTPQVFAALGMTSRGKKTLEVKRVLVNYVYASVFTFCFCSLFFIWLTSHYPFPVCLAFAIITQVGVHK